MSIQITITNAGRAEIINAANTGTAPVTITHVGVGTGQYVPAATQTTLQAETKRLATIAGQVVADDTIHITIKDESNDAYNVSEFGLFTDSGTLFAVYSQNTGPFMQKAGPSTLLLSVDILLGTLDANNIAFGETGFSNPPASETVAGVVELATPAETATGTDAARAVTPAGLKPLLDVRQPLDATLTALAALATVADRLIYATGPDAFGLATFTAYGRTLVAAADAAYARGVLSVPSVAEMNAAIAALVEASPAALDTLNELAAALGDDPNFATTITNALGLKAPLASPAFTGTPTAPTAVAGTNNTQLATTEFVQQAFAPGNVALFAQNTAPSGYLKANGATISRTTYAALFAAIGTTFGVGDGATTFKLPDLRGEFLRGFDDGRGIDTGRVLGSFQAATQIKGYIASDVGNSTGAAYVEIANAESGTISTLANNYLNVSMSASGGGEYRGRSSVRPRNVALLACIKY